jgi:hypothetical protein
VISPLERFYPLHPFRLKIFMRKKQEKLSIRTACLWIMLFTLAISGSAFGGLIYYKYIKRQRLYNSQYNIVAIAQTTPDKEPLKTAYLAELLNLSIDQPTNIFRFNTQAAQQKLLNSPLITHAYVKKILPGTIYVDYELRKPFAYLLDYHNTVIDREGVTFPFKPFFTPKKLPEIYLGITDSSPLSWGKPLQEIKCKLALYLIDLLSTHCCSEYSYLSRVDVSQAFADSKGKRQIVAILDEQVEKTDQAGKLVKGIASHILRLSVDNYRQELANYLQLRPLLKYHVEDAEEGEAEKLLKFKPLVVDLRIPALAYIKSPAL